MISGYIIKTIASKFPSTKTRLGTVRLDCDSPEAISDQDRAAVAAKYWSNLWSRRSNHITKTDRLAFLNGYNKKVDSSLCQALNLDDIKKAILISNNSTPGPDGIPFAAWRAAPELAAPVLFNVYRAMSNGQPPPPGFNKGVLFLLPKKPSGLIADTRPLSVTNADNRIIAAAAAHKIMPAVLSFIEQSQKGFLNERSGSDHIVDVTEFFYQGVEEDLDRHVFLLDTAKAFDSIDHKWIFTVLRS